MNIFTFIEKFKIEIQKTLKLNETNINNIHFFFNQNVELAHISTNFIFLYSKLNPKLSIVLIKESLDKILKSFTTNFPAIKILKTTLNGKFFNIFFEDSTLFYFFQESLTKAKTKLDDKKINIEYVSANPTGPLHFGHLRNGVVGDTLANILKFLDLDVTRYFYTNDSGNQIINLGYSIIHKYLKKLQLNYYFVDEKIKLYDSHYIDEIIIHLQNDSNNKFNDQYFLNSKPITLDLVKHLSELGHKYILSEIQKTLKNFKIEFDEFISEKKMIYEYFEPSIARLKENDFLYQKDNKTLLKTTLYNDEIDRVLVKEDKTYTYIVGDICYHYFRFVSGFDYLINIWGADHHGYVNRVKAIALPLGLKENNLRFGIIQFVSIIDNENKITKMSKRNKNVINADDLYKNFGSDILRFFLVSVSIDSHLHINLDLLKIKNNNNIFYYCQYAYIRIFSLLKKVDKTRLQEIENQKFENLVLNINERKLLLFAISFFQVLKNCYQKLDPVFLQTYLIKLSKLFHSFYNHEKILNPSQLLYNKKIKIIIQLKKHFETCFKLLKITPFEKM